MINIYSKLDAIPNDKVLVFDVHCGLSDIDIDITNETAREIIFEIDRAEFISDSEIKDRFGDKINIYDLSTSSIALLCALFGDKKYVYNFSEVGHLAWDYLQVIMDCSVYTNRVNINISYLRNLSINGVTFRDGKQADYYLEVGELPLCYAEA